MENFRALRSVDIAFDSVTTFIGPNGSGKSTILRALDWFFNGGRASQLSDDDCSVGAESRQISVEVTFDSLTDEDRAALGKYVAPGAESFTAWKTRTEAGEEYLSANARGNPLFNEVKSAPRADAKKELYKALRAEHATLSLPAATTAAAIDDALTAWEAEHVDDLVDLPENLQTNFFGFNSDSKMSGIFDFVLVTADLRATEEAQDAKATIIGRILERAVDRTAADEKIKTIVEESRLAQQEAYREQFADGLSALSDDLNRVVSSYSPGRSVSVATAEVELKAPRTTFKVSILDGDTETTVGNQGHGFQRTLLISALQLLAQSSAAGASGVICLAIEEPELFQHPVQAQAFAKVLRSLAEAADQKIQVTYATHSPYFVEARAFHQVRRFTRSADAVPDVSVDHSSTEQVTAHLNGIVGAAQVRAQLDGTVATKLPVALFANRVLLVEGTTEEAVLSGIADISEVGHLEREGIAVVAVGGKGNIMLARAILRTLNIPVFCVFDADGGQEARSLQAGKDPDKVASDRAGHVSQNKKLMTMFGLSPEDFPPLTETPEVTIFPDNLEETLRQEWPEWFESCDAYAQASGTDLAKNQHAYRIVTAQSLGSPSPTLLGVIDRLKAL